MNAQQLKAELVNTFNGRFGGQPTVFRSPGRVNIIGEHTDYNEGFVLPAAIDKGIYVAISARQDDGIHLYSNEFNEMYEGSIEGLSKSNQQWANYILGVVAQMIKNGYQPGGFNLVIDGNIPIGAGLSSSAAVECATAYALNDLFQLGISKMDLVKMAQKAEHEYAGVMCGIMDQFASMHGKKDHVIRLDCRSLEYEYVPLQLQGYKIVLLNTNVKHSLADSEYNVRRRQCEQGVALVKAKYPQVNSLRDVTLKMLEELVKEEDKLIYTRCKYVVEENQRLLQGCENLIQGDLGALGKEMYASHEGLSKEYEVSCKELDFLVDYARREKEIIGARMMGGGFGGCTINLIQEDAVERLVEEMKVSYQNGMNKELTAYVAVIDQGTSRESI
ncbi:MAG TPA: galactokinase [Flavisolibacter sp.]|nr:galactokinase [Flavisolibacter sp.]